jgi:TrbL/VirB6 plasmid conjugal transfer protein
VLGFSVHQMFTEEARWLSAQVDIAILDRFLVSMQQVFGGMEKPHYWDLPAVLMYVGVIIDMVLLEGALFIVTSFSFIALGVGIVWGPFAICAFMFRATSYLGWAWINYMIKYSLYRVVASMLVFVIATICMDFIQGSLNGDYSIGHWWALIVPFSLITMAGLYGCLQIPQMVNDLTTGIAYAGAGFGGTVFGLARGIR